MNIQLKDSENNKMYPLGYYPIGAIYMSYEPTSPAEIFGGTWLQLVNNFLFADVSSNENSRGEIMHVLDINEIPSHRHGVKIKTATSSSSQIDLFDGFQNIDNNKASNISFNYTGNTEAHENMPPYEAVYMWRRIE